jgi:hypothetical protein
MSWAVTGVEGRGWEVAGAGGRAPRRLVRRSPSPRGWAFERDFATKATAVLPTRRRNAERLRRGSHPLVVLAPRAPGPAWWRAARPSAFPSGLGLGDRRSRVLLYRTSPRPTSAVMPPLRRRRAHGDAVRTPLATRYQSTCGSGAGCRRPRCSRMPSPSRPHSSRSAHRART